MNVCLCACYLADWEGGRNELAELDGGEESIAVELQRKGAAAILPTDLVA